MPVVDIMACLAEYPPYVFDPCFALRLYSARPHCTGYFRHAQANLYRQALHNCPIKILQ